MIELEYDKKKKLGVVYLLYLLVVAVIFYLYYTDTKLDLESMLMDLI